MDIHLFPVWRFDSLSKSLLSFLMVDGIERDFSISEDLEPILTELGFAEFTVSHKVCMYLV